MCARNPRPLPILLAAWLASTACIQAAPPAAAPPITESLTEFVSQFKGRGAITDDSSHQTTPSAPSRSPPASK